MSLILYSKFSDILRDLLKKQNLKQADLCRMTGIQSSLVSDYLAGKKSPTIGNAILIADALHISLDSLVGNEKFPNIENKDNFWDDDKWREVITLLDALHPYFQHCAIEQIKKLAKLQDQLDIFNSHEKK